MAKRFECSLMFELWWISSYLFTCLTNEKQGFGDNISNNFRNINVYLYWVYLKADQSENNLWLLIKSFVTYWQVIHAKMQQRYIQS